MEHLEFKISTIDQDADLRAGDFESGPSFREDLQLFLEDSTPDETIAVSLLPPFAGRFAAPGAVDIIVEVLNKSESPPRLRLLVASQGAIEKLRPRLHRSSIEPIRYQAGALSIEVTLGDITEVEADAIVNASNTRLALGAGVSGAIRRKAHPSLQDALFAIARRSPVLPGEVIITDSFGLPKTKKILHTPTASGKEEVIDQALRGCLLRANQEGFRSLAIPALGSGTGGLGTARFAELAANALRDFADEVSSPALRAVIVVLWTVIDFDEVTGHMDSRFQRGHPG